ncbi:MAG: hypothetical protein ACRYG4_16360 [Janthinobacterium lividum]
MATIPNTAAGRTLAGIAGRLRHLWGRYVASVVAPPAGSAQDHLDDQI